MCVCVSEEMRRLWQKSQQFEEGSKGREFYTLYMQHLLDEACGRAYGEDPLGREAERREFRKKRFLHPSPPPPAPEMPPPEASATSPARGESRWARGGGAGSSGGITEAGRGSQGGGGAGGGSRMESGSVVHRRQVRTAHVMAVAALGLVGGAFVSLGLRRRGSKQGEGLRPPPRVVI